MPKHPPRNWASITRRHGVKGDTHRRFVRWIQNFIESHAPGDYIGSTRDLMAEFGYDHRLVSDYMGFLGMLKRLRDTARDSIPWVVNSEQFQRWAANNGHEDAFIHAMRSAAASGIIALINDGVGWRLMRYSDLNVLDTKRVKSIESEVKLMVTRKRELVSAFPELVSGQGLVRMPVLPTYPCETCQVILPSQRALVDHYTTEHSSVAHF